MSEKKPTHAKPSLYAFYFEAIKKIGLGYGYNIVLHGSMNRDLDLIAIPWRENVKSHENMVKAIAKFIGGEIMMQLRSTKNIKGVKYQTTYHGRMQYVININRSISYKHNGMVISMETFPDPQYYIDISVIPAIK
jgi:hypothetical protein